MTSRPFSKRTGDKTEEICRAFSFFVNQLERGWKPEEALHQVGGSYGWAIQIEVYNTLRDWLLRNK